MKEKIMNLLSGKFIMTLIATVIGIATMATNTDNAYVQIVGLIVILLAQIVYNIVEGTIDAKSMITLTAQTLTTISDLLNKTAETKTETPEKTDAQKALEAIAKTVEATTKTEESEK